MNRPLTLLIALFAGNLVLANLLAAKIVPLPFFPTLAVSVTTLTYPFTFLISDIISEIWGKRQAKEMVHAGLLLNLITFLTVYFALYMPEHPTVEGMGAAFERVFSPTGWLVLGSTLAYYCAQLLDLTLFAWLKEKLKGEYLGVRGATSTAIAQAVDAAIMGFFFLYIGLGLSGEQALELSLIDYTIKVGLAVIQAPLLCAAVRFLRLTPQTTAVRDYS